MRTNKLFPLLVAVITAVVFVASVSADLVTCESEVCGYTNTRDYYYVVTIDEGSTLTGFEVATDDGILSDYSNWVMPTDWTYTIVGNDNLLKDLPYTSHGEVTSYDGPSAYKIIWSGTTLNVGTYYFGFDNANAPENAGWTIDNASTNWSSAVSSGEGPIHAPVPEPVTLALLAMGGLTLIRRQKA
jgi:general stress protein CsbA